VRFRLQHILMLESCYAVFFLALRKLLSSRMLSSFFSCEQRINRQHSGCIFLMSSWYRADALAHRIAILYTGVALAKMHVDPP
jgi:hypothetical protein